MAIIDEKSWTVGELLNWTAQFLAQKGVEYPRLDAEVLLAHAHDCKRIDLYGLKFGEVADDDLRRRYKDLIRRRLEGCPVAYLVERKEFFALEFEVTPAVLIPRPDSELVVMTCLELAKRLPEPRIVDVGTGSGNLAVATAHGHKGSRVTAVDASVEALAVARRNAAKHGVADRIHFLHGDLLTPLAAGATFDFILSNPPYIPREDLDQLPAGVRNYEPRQALDGGHGGFAVFDRLIAAAPDCLSPGGYLIVEIGAPQEQAARERLAAMPQFELDETLRDFSGHPRVLRARRK